MRRSLIGGVVVLGLAGLFAAGCGGAPSGGEAKTDSAPKTTAGGTTITATLKEFTIELDAKTAKAGAVTFKTTNKGTTPHELMVIKSDLAPDKLPVKDAKADETGLTVLGEVAEMASGKTDSKTFELAAGKYLLICNIPAHYQAGMTLAFTVQ